MEWVIEGKLARSSRPGYDEEDNHSVGPAVVNEWLEDARGMGIKSVICLLGEDQLSYYLALLKPLPEYCRTAGFNVAHIPATDYQQPPLTRKQLEKVWWGFCKLPKPILVHCSAGLDRTGAAARHIIAMTGSRRVSD